jgi:predicted ATPase/DNA-binding SARP family transcriptional activator
VRAHGFIGRHQALAELEHLLSGARLLTMTGGGGCGKTRLARQVADRLNAQTPDPVAWIDLAPLAEGTLLASIVAAALGVPEQPGVPPLQVLAEALRSRQQVVVLDNCEHLLAASSELVRRLLHDCADLRFLITSREPLRLPGEHTYAVSPLSVPPANADLEQLSHSEAVQLFVSRAAEVLPAFALTPDNAPAVANICRTLDGLPLAIELAAARLKVLAVGQIAQRLSDSLHLLTSGHPATRSHHLTLQAAIDWSYALLTDRGRALLRRLSAFAGGFTLEAVEVVCADAQLPAAALLDELAELVEKSLVVVASRAEPAVYYRLLETIRQYGREALVRAGETESIRTQHLAWFLALAERPAALPQAAHFAQLEAEQDNFRAALQWARSARDWESGLRLAGALFSFWLARGYLAEGRGWLEELLDLGGAEASGPVRAKAQYGAAVLAFRHGDRARAEQLAEANLAQQRALDNASGAAGALNLLAILATERGEYELAAERHAEALRLRRALNDLAGISTSLLNLGVIARGQGDFARARELYTEGLALKQQLGDQTNMAVALSNLGEIAVLQGDYAGGAALVAESLALYRALGHRNGIALALNNLANAARQQGDLNAAEAGFTEAVALRETMGEPVRLGQARLNLGDLARDRGEWVRAATIYQECLAVFRAAEDAPSLGLAYYGLGLVAAQQGDDARAQVLFDESLDAYARGRFPLGQVEALEELAGLALGRGDAAQAARLLGTAQAQRTAMQAPVRATDRERVEQFQGRARAALGEAAFAAGLAAGRGLSLAEVHERLRPKPAPAHTNPAPSQPALRVQALGAARVWVGPTPVPDSAWTYAKARELVFYLLARGAVTKEQLSLDLWPDASPAQLRSTFHRTLYHARQALGRAEWIIYDGEHYRLPLEPGGWYDVQTFEQHLAEARRHGPAAATSHAAGAAALEHLSAAVSLYHGDYLASLPAGDWALAQRETLHRRHLEARLSLGQHYFREGRYAEAAAIHRETVALDPYLETAHRELMRCYARQSETSQAARHYQALCEQLRRELGADPAPETALLYERLRRGDDV